MDFNGFIACVKKNQWELHGIEVFEKGDVIAQYHEDMNRRYPIYSATKSITALAVGLAIDDGRFDINQSIYEYLKSEIPTYTDHKTISNLKEISVKRLLTMSVHGYEFRAQSDNWLEYSLIHPLENVKEKVFHYSNIPAYLVGVAVAKALNIHLYDYLEERIFEPLEIKKPTYQNCPSGYFYGASGIELTVHELSKIGQLCLQKGCYNGYRIISEEYIEEATSVQQMNREGGYGYYFWKYKDGYRISGKWGKRCIIFPAREFMVTYLSHVEQNSEDLTKAMEDYILC